ncbi:MAG: PAS domain S-box protein [Spirochaetaceae bacterium]|nr:MAG: PAS domain S-box protein [Spirochaetaceae bacterium]
MGSLNWLRFNTLSVGSLTTTLLLALITGYLLSLKRKHKDTWYLAGYLGALLIMLLSYTVRYSLFASTARHTGQFSNLIVFATVSLIQFAYWYGGNQRPRESRIILVVSLAAAFMVWGSLFLRRNLEISYDFKAQYFSYEYGPRVSFFTLLGFLWASMVLFRKAVRSSSSESGVHRSRLSYLTRPVGRVAQSARSFALLTVATTIIALAYMLFQTGVISRNTYTLVFNSGSLLICLLIFIVYVNNAPQPTSYVSKLIGIPLAVIMVAFGITASALMPVVHSGLADHYRREIDQAGIAIQNQDWTGLSSSIAYILGTDSSPPEVKFVTSTLSEADLARLAAEQGAEGLIPARRGLTPRFLSLDLHDTGSFYLYYTIEQAGHTYRIGLPYRDYRLWIHRFCSKLALVAVVTCILVVLGFPVAFRHGLLRPLVTLHEAVRQVSSGNYRMYLPVPSEDEVGQLARGYNQMVSYLREAEGNFKALAENSADAILIFSSDGRILYANQRCTEISGYSPVELRQMHFRDVVHAGDLAAVTHHFSERMAGREAPRCYETRIIGKDSRVIPVEVTGARTTWQKQAADVVIIRDISERKEAEQQLQAQQQQLMRTDKLASLGALVAGVAHEVNNPNQVIGMNSRFLLDGLPQLFVLAESSEPADETMRLSGMSYGEFKKAVESATSEINSSTTRIDHIVGELKRFVRGGSRANRVPTDINQVIRTVADLSRHMIGRTTDHFELDLQSDLPRLVADRIRLEQVVLNLLQNACQALEDRQQQVRVSTSFDANLNSVRIEVADQGAGIRPEDLERITDPFFTTRGEQGGTGLGLSVSQRIIREHGGTMSFRSTSGRGTTVTVDLPLADSSH